MLTAWMRYWALPVLVGVLLVCNGSFGQSGNQASISGFVADRSGAVLSGVDITVTQLDTGHLTRAVSDSHGHFEFSLISSGDYRLVASRAGFANYDNSSVRLTAGSHVSLSIFMRIATRTEVSNVVDPGVLSSKQASDVSTTVDSQFVSNLPVNGRNFTDLVLITGGVTRNARNGGDFSFSGQHQMNSVLVDGLDDTDTFFGTSIGHGRSPFQFSQDSIQEFQVLANSYSAEFGRAGGGAVNAVTKSGTNAVHGSAFWLLRDRSMNANDPINKLNGLSKSAYHFNNFGTTLGGPVVRERAFFFFSYEGQRSAVQNNTILGIPASFHVSADPFVAAYQLQALSYLRNRATPWVQPNNLNVLLLKGDLYATNRHELSARWNRQRLVTATATGAQNSWEHTDPTTEDTDSLGAALTSTFSATKVNVVRFGYTHGGQEIVEGTPNPEATVSEGGQVVLIIGRNQNSPGKTVLRRFEVSEKFSFTRGRHTLELGLDEVWDQTTFVNATSFTGSYRFQSLESFGRSLSGTPKPITGEQFQQSFSNNRTYPTTVQPNSSETAVFLQDDWRLRPTLSLSLGLRYDIQWMESPDVRNPSPALAAVGLRTDAIPTDLNNIAPRVGIAWSPARIRNTVFRAGYGVFYARTQSIMPSRAFFQNGVSVQPILFTAGTANARLIPAYPNNLCGQPGTPLTCQVPNAGTSNPSITLFQPDYVEPYVQQGNVAIERVFSQGTTVSASYLFAKGMHLQRTRDINLTAPLTRTFIGVAQQPTVLAYDRYTAPRPIAGFDRIWQFSSDASSVYHGLLLELRQQFRNSFQATISYTYSKVLDDNPDPSATNFGNSDFKLVQYGTAPGLDRSVSINDQRHRFVFAGTWEIPTSERLPSAVHRLTNGWQVSGIVTAQSGLPYSALVSFDLNNDLNAATDRVPGQARNACRLPATVSVDPRLSKFFHVHERSRLQVSVEAFNILNRTNITSVRPTMYARSTNAALCGVAGMPCLVPQNAGLLAFGTPTASSGPRIVQVGARLSF